MKKNSSIFATLFLVYLFCYVDTCPAYGQASRKPSDYEYLLGEKIGRALSRDCSVSRATVKSVEPDRVYFNVNEYYRFTDDKEKGDMEISVRYRNRQPNSYISDSDRWWSYVNRNTGTNALVFLCEQGKLATYHAFVTTDAKYFDKIKAAVELTETFRKDTGEFINYFENNYKTDTDLNKAVAIQFLVNLKIPRDAGAYIAVELLEKTLVWKKEPITLAVIQDALSIKTIYSLPEFRSKAFSALLKIANGDDEKAREATLILTKIAESNSVELKNYLKPENTRNIQMNLQKIPAQMLTGDQGKRLSTLLTLN
jgi:hypothetical protein